MLERLLVIAVLCGLVGCAGLRQAPPEFNVEVAPRVLATPDSVVLARRVAEALPDALHQVEEKLGYTPRNFTILICRSSCFLNHISIPGAAAAQTKDRVFLNADLPPSISLKSVLTHELAHLLIEERRGDELHKVPEWANEGIAVWVSGAGTEGCPGAGERMQRHPICQARKASNWIDELAVSDPHAQRCWLNRMVTGKQVEGCPGPGTMYPQF